MTTTEIKRFIDENVISNQGYPATARTKENSPFRIKHKEIFDTIINNLHNPLPNSRHVKFSELIYCFINDITTIPICPVCEKELVVFRTYSKGHGNTCSSKCSNSHDNKSKETKSGFEKPKVKENIRKATEKRVERMKLDGSYDKIAEKTKQRWDNYTEEERKEVGNKISKSLLEMDENVKRNKNKKMKQSKLSNIDENGHNSYERVGIKNKERMKNLTDEEKQIISDKIRNSKSRIDEETGLTILELSSIKSEQTKIEKYGIGGCVNPEKRKETLLERYGVDNGFKTNKAKQASKNAHKKKWISGKTNYYNSCVEDYDNEGNMKLLTTLEEYLNSDGTVEFQCTRCSQKISRYIKSCGSMARCPKCDSNKNFLASQKEVYNYLMSLDDSFLFNDRSIIKSPKSNRYLEVDILSRDLKFGIEYDGIKWHSFGYDNSSKFHKIEESLDKKSHLIKTELVEEKGYQLFRIFSNEWEDKNKKEIWKSVFNTQLGMNKRIYARQCEIREVDFNDANTFLKMNHLQGQSVSSIRYGLYYEDNLVSLMTFSKSRYRKDIEWELMRFCSSKNISVIGGASKLLKYFERNIKPTSLISYANRRWSIGNVYEKLGFYLKGKTQPNYFYFIPRELELHSREKFQKHKLKEFEAYSEDKTESEIMYESGYRKIYDCGNLIFIKVYNK